LLLGAFVTFQSSRPQAQQRAWSTSVLQREFMTNDPFDSGKDGYAPVPRHSWHLRTMQWLGLPLFFFALGGCNAAQASAPTALAAATPDAAQASTRSEESSMWMTVGERRFSITLADNEAARAFAAMLPLTIDMADLNSNEKHADLPQSLPTNASRPGTIRNGDLMLYGSRTLVVFYLTFDSSYSYTRLGRVNDPSGLSQALGRRGVRIVFSKN
jgi:hypothetical protein